MPRTSFKAMVWPVASTMEIKVNSSSGKAAIRSKLGGPKGKGDGRASSGPLPTPLKLMSPIKAADKAPTIKPSKIASWRHMPLSSRANSTVDTMVIRASNKLSVLPKLAEPGVPAISLPEICARLMATSKSMMPITSDGK